MKAFTATWKTALLFAIAMINLANANESTSVLDACKWKVEPLGCYDDKLSDRAMPEQIINERDPYSHVHNGILINWNRYHQYLQEFICRCADKAFAKGYKVIGIQFYGECWSGPRAHEGYKKHDSSLQCLNGEYKDCKKGGPVCTGTTSTNFAYRIAPTACDIAYEPFGCFKDNNINPRPFSDYIMNERDFTHPNWNGHLVNWKDWDIYSPAFLCRCAKAVKEKGFTFFGAQFYGECWSGKNVEETMKRDGTSDRCVAEKYEKCPYNSFHCVGQDHANQVYKLVEMPLPEFPAKR